MNPFDFVPRFNIDLIFLLVTIVLIWIISILNKKHTIPRSVGVIQVIAFIIYILRLFIV